MALAGMVFKAIKQGVSSASQIVIVELAVCPGVVAQTGKCAGFTADQLSAVGANSLLAETHEHNHQVARVFWDMARVRVRRISVLATFPSGQLLLDRAREGWSRRSTKRPANELTQQLGMQLMQGATGHDDAKDMIQAAGFDQVTAQAFVTKSGVFSRAAKRPANELTRELGMQLMQGATGHNDARDMIHAAGFDQVTAQAFVTKSGVFSRAAKRPANELTRELGMQLMQGATGHRARDMIHAAGFTRRTAQAFVAKLGLRKRRATRSRPANELTRELGMQLMQGATGHRARDMIHAAGFTRRTAQAFLNQMKS